MNQKTQFEASGSQLKVTRIFNAPIELVWRAWTEPELLDQWWAPKPWRSKTKEMNFVPKGKRLYAMVGPEGEEHWAITTYDEINKPLTFSGSDAFCNNEGLVNENLPVATFTNQFLDNSVSTKVIVVSNYASEEHLNQVIQMGMKEGLKMTFEYLEQLLLSLN